MKKAVKEQRRLSLGNKYLSLIISLLLFFNANIFAQFPNNSTTGNASTLYHDAGGRTANGGFVNTRFSDTATANTYPIAGQKGGQIIVGNTVYLRDSTVTKWIPIGTGSGGSGTDSAAFHTITQGSDSSYAKFNRPNGTGTVLKVVYDTTGGGGSGGITQQQLDDTASAIRGSYYIKSQIDAFLAAKQNTINVTTTGSGAATWDGTNLNIPTPSIPAQFNPIAGANMTLSGAYPNITFNASSSGGSVTTVSANAPLFVTNPTTTPNIAADTSKSQGKLATFNDVLIHKDSSAYHTSQVIGDTSLVLCDLKGRCDTVNIAAINLWSRHGNGIYYKTGRVGVGVDTAQSLLNVQNLSTIANAPLNDSSALTLSNGNIATSSNIYYSPSLIFKSQSWNTSSTLPISNKFKFDVTPFSGVPGASHSSLNLKYSQDNGITYTTLITLNDNGLISFGASNINNNTINTGVVNVTQSVNSSTLSASTYANVGSAFNGNDAQFQINGVTGTFLPTRVTKAQRDSINLTVTSVTIVNGGTGYATPPSLSFAGTFTFQGNAKQAAATATVSGGAITAVTVTAGGAYVTTPTVGVTGGGGTGAVLKSVVSQVLTTGSTVYCTDCIATDSSTGVMQTWNGTTWKNYW